MKATKITADELKEKFEKKSNVIVLDVRPQQQRDDWQISGSIYKDIYDRLQQGDSTVFDDMDLPKEATIVTVCAAGRSSQLAADILADKGYYAQSLEGGMKAWNYAWNTAEASDDTLTIIQVRRVAKGCLSYIIGSGKSAMVIDASLDPEVYFSLASTRDWNIIYVSDTHIHADYISRSIELVKVTGATHLFTENADVDYPFVPLADGQQLRLGDAYIKAIHTPGHTPESISYLIDESYLLTGDTLFVDGVGRPDLKADAVQTRRKAQQLFVSLSKIKGLPNDPLILPAHTSHAIDFDNVIIGNKLSGLVHQIELLNIQEQQFVASIVERIPQTPANYLQISAINKAGQHDGIDPADLEAGANRCAIA
ncbi:MBL fold metallo-hydrolase [Dyadobacter jiangsuensis]|uniref:Glyoxylase-like metal-dependent hydrolase (Beta-lactamase superfamily II) n=1 Tax=Dyadobacter jiangsuensis TaxID=1591085 RepID=A0A2P8G194_9BACT|nr:MBL fold metallo-hydrolase [Dyadobacter jiangsuensis]PSL27739.1 glyoxylase-like metal-dependent hydrolase (beta-lactamase superfamily II) [Dyadobacter jiangsuensis]